jgi:hypothetical protein
MALSPFSGKFFGEEKKKILMELRLMLVCIKENKTFPHVGVIGRCPVLRVLFA